MLLLGLGGLTTALGGLFVLALQIGQRNTNELMRMTAGLRIDSMARELESHLAPARSQVQFLARALSDGRIDGADEQRVQDLLLGSLAAAPQIAAVAYVGDELRAVFAGRDIGDADTGNWIDRPEVRLLARNARLNRGFVWGSIVYVPSLDNTVVAASMAVLQEGEYRGVVTAAVSITELSELLPAADSGPAPAHPFVLRGDDEVIAHPLLARTHFDLSVDRPLPRRDEIGDPILAAMWPAEPGGSFEELGRSFEGFDSGAVRGHLVTVGGEEHAFIYRDFASFGSPPWLVGMHLRVADVSVQVERVRRAGIVGGACLLVAALLAYLLARSLSRPIRELAEAAAAIGDLDIERSRPLRGSPYRELDAAAHAFNTMRAGLRWFATYVPRSLVLRLVDEAGQGELQSEEREVTVLFTDIVGFTAIGGRLPAPALAAFLNRHFALLAGCIEAEGGTVDKYIGDSVMAFWGAPAAQPDHALRACRAALAIAGVVRADNERRRRKTLRPVRLRIGIHTGPVVVGNVGAPGRINYTLIGETVNLAQRLEQLGKTADTGSEDVIVLVSRATADALAGALPVTALGPRRLRGHEEDVEVFRLG